MCSKTKLPVISNYVNSTPSSRGTRGEILIKGVGIIRVKMKRRNARSRPEKAYKEAVCQRQAISDEVKPLSKFMTL